MKALIRKDISIMKRDIVFIVIFSIVFGAYAVNKSVFLAIPAIAIMVPIILTSITFAYDAKANFEQFAFAMPVGKKDYVLSKLFFALSFSLITSICLFIILDVKNMGEVRTILTISLLNFVISLLFSAIQLPFILKFGAEKSRIIMIATYAIIFAGISLAREYGANIISQINKFSQTSIGLIVSLLGLLVILFCIRQAIKVVENKEY